MRRLRTSLFSLTLLAFGAVLLPLALAVTTAVLAVDRLAEQSEHTVRDAASTMESARALVDHAQAMERHARQLSVLDDARYAELYASRRADFLKVAAQLLEQSHRPTIQALLAREAAAHDDLLASAPESPERAAALGELTEVTRSSRDSLTAATRAVGVAAEQVASDAAAVQRNVFLMAGMVVPLLVVVLIAAAVVIVRPVQQLDQAIRELGGGDLDQPITIRGTHDLQQLGERLEWLRERLLAVESDRVRLFRHVSHELKTPLACIREGTELLIDEVPGPVSSSQQEVLGILQSNAAELQQRIEDILRISEIRKGDTRLDREALDLSEVVDRVTARHAIRARANTISLSTELPTAPAFADAHKVATVIDNLLTNALKFSPAGGTLDVSVQPGSPHRVVVQDEGPGIPPAERERVFETFYQGRTSANVRGTGLGLSIAREYARAHGGDVVVEPSDRGARLVATFPSEMP